ncbi:MAG: chemotaxis protein CheW [Candidatus Competibacterales bacterium]|nr:chemotaxis protein CheW [Candidatus Competibacterales bacterium]
MAPTVCARDRIPERYGFRIGELGLLIESGTLGEILTDAEIHPLPLAPPALLGLINLRGNLIPVYGIASLLDQDEPEDDHFFLLVLGEGDEAVALRLTCTPVALVLGPCRPLPDALPDALRDCALEAREADGQIWLEFDHRRFFESLVHSIDVQTAAP